MTKILPEDQLAYDVLKYQIGKSLDMAMIEDVPFIVEDIDAAVRQEDPNKNLKGHQFQTADPYLYQLPSGQHVDVSWQINLVDPVEAQERIREAEEEMAE